MAGIKPVVCALAGMGILSTAVAAGSASAAAPKAAAKLTADYQFFGKLTPCGGTKAFTPYPGTAFGSESVDGKSRTVLTFKADSGIHLDGVAGTMPSSTYTVVALFRFAEITGWRMIMDVKNSSGDDAFYNYYGKLQWYPLATSPKAVIAANTWVQVAVTRSGNKITGYVNGKKAYSVADPTGYGTVSSAQVVSFFKDNNGVGSEESAGAVARIRFYDGALSAAAIKALDRSPAAPCP